MHAVRSLQYIVCYIDSHIPLRLPGQAHVGRGLPLTCSCQWQPRSVLAWGGGSMTGTMRGTVTLQCKCKCR